MKKTYNLIDSKNAPERVADKIKFEVKKYIKRERNKELPEGVDFWDFDCKFGENEESSKAIHLSEINSNISKLVTDKVESFYLEIVAKHGFRTKKDS